jgi:hypothetical protein
MPNAHPSSSRWQSPAKTASDKGTAAAPQKKNNVTLLVALALALTVMLVVVAIVANQLAH